MGIRVTQTPVEAVITSTARNFRLSQGAVEVIISSVSTPSKVRFTQAAVEILVTNVTPVPPTVTRRYGPRIQSV